MILCTICARGGSKGVKAKNLRLLCGEPLIAWTIKQALRWGKADYVVVSTDSPEIAETARSYGALVPFLRPAELATDRAPKLPVIQHAVRFMEHSTRANVDYVVDLDPTSPLRQVTDIEEAWRLLVDRRDANNIYSVCRAKKSPYFNMVEVNCNGYAELSKQPPSAVVRRQDAPTVYEMNASIYIYRKEFLLEADSIHSDKTLVYEMPVERSIDIDTEVDLKLVELLMRERKSLLNEKL